MKICSKCGKEKDVSEFYTRRYRCKVCYNAEKWKYRRSEKGRAVRRKYLNTEKGRAANRKYAQSDKGRAIVRKRNNKPINKIKKKLLERLRHFIIGRDSQLNRETMGCTRDEFRAHYESLFKPGMTWENYGEWENDHIKEMSKFDLENEETWKECMHYSNLQPQWKTLNRKNIH